MTRPDLDAIRARVWSISTTASTFAGDVAALLAHIEELESVYERLRGTTMLLDTSEGRIFVNGEIVAEALRKFMEP